MKHPLDVGQPLEYAPNQFIPIEDEDARYAFIQGWEDYKASRYKQQRAEEYPPISEYLDGIVKGDQVQIQAYIDACLAVKAKYPKPE